MTILRAGKDLNSHFDLLKQKLRQSLDAQQGRGSGLAIAITSSVFGEGVSTTALNMAASFSTEEDLRILLVDGNLSGKGPERHLGKRKIVHADVLPAGTGPNSWPINSLSSNLDLLSCNRASRHHGQDCFYSQFGPGLIRARETYNLVILDCPPVPTMFSSLHLFRSVDGVILVIEADRLRYEIVQKNLEILTELGAPILGCILNKRRFPIPGFLYRKL